MRRFLLALGLASLAIALALVAGAHLPNGALPVVLGVLAGIAASLPTSLIIVWRVTKAPSRPAPVPTPAAAERTPTVAPTPAVPQPPQPSGLVRETRPSTIIGGRDEA